MLFLVFLYFFFFIPLTWINSFFLPFKKKNLLGVKMNLDIEHLNSTFLYEREREKTKGDRMRGER